MKICMISSDVSTASGASIEAQKWGLYYQSLGFAVWRCSGQPINEGVNSSELVIPEISMTSQFNLELERYQYELHVPGNVLKLVQQEADRLYLLIKQFLFDNSIRLIHVEGAFTYCVSLALSQALIRLVKQDNVFAISRVHDLIWDRQYVADSPLIKLQQLPFVHTNIFQATLTNASLQALREYNNITKGCVVPNLFDFDLNNSLHKPNAFRLAYNIPESEVVILQPSRGTFKKGLHHSLILANKIQQMLDFQTHLVVTGRTSPYESGYREFLEQSAYENNVRIYFLDGKLVGLLNQSDKSALTITDAYLASDLISMPSINEGFGNPLVESTVVRKPMFTNTFTTLHSEFLSKGLRYILSRDPYDLSFGMVRDYFQKGFTNVFDLSQFALDKIPLSETRLACHLLTNDDLREDWVNSNFEISKEYYSNELIKMYLNPILLWCQQHKLKESF